MGPSGFDIGLEVATRAREVVLCHNSEAWPAPLPANVSQRAGIVACSVEGDLLLADGSRLRAVDALVHCTGYNYSYPFLSRSCGLEFAGRQVRTLYKQLVNAARPTMALVGIPQMVLPFRLFDLQVGLRLSCILNVSQYFFLPLFSSGALVRPDPDRRAAAPDPGSDEAGGGGGVAEAV